MFVLSITVYSVYQWSQCSPFCADVDTMQWSAVDLCSVYSVYQWSQCSPFCADVDTMQWSAVDLCSVYSVYQWSQCSPFCADVDTMQWTAVDLCIQFTNGLNVVRSVLMQTQCSGVLWTCVFSLPMVSM